MNKAQKKRLEEMKAKSVELNTVQWMSPEEQVEFKELTDLSEASKQQEEVVEIKKADLEGILARVSQLEKEARSGQKKAGLYPNSEWREAPEEEKVYTATMRTWKNVADDLPIFITDWYYLKDSFNERTRITEQIYLFRGKDWDGKSVEFELPLLEFVKKAERIEVKVLNKSVKKLSKTSGYVNASQVKFSEYKTVVGGKVPLVETMDEIFVDVETEDGRVFKGLPQRMLNA